jgi:hypothetical protein
VSFFESLESRVLLAWNAKTSRDHRHSEHLCRLAQGDNVGERLANEEKGLPPTPSRLQRRGERWTLWGSFFLVSAPLPYCTSMVPAQADAACLNIANRKIQKIQDVAPRSVKSSENGALRWGGPPPLGMWYGWMDGQIDRQKGAATASDRRVHLRESR